MSGATGATQRLVRRTVEQQRADFALTCLNRYIKADGTPLANQATEAADYRRQIERLPALILSSGLGQALATLLAAQRGVAARQVADDLARGLIAERGLYPGPEKETPSGLVLLRRLAAGTPAELRVATDEALALLIWFSKLARGFLPKSREE